MLCIVQLLRVLFTSAVAVVSDVVYCADAACTITSAVAVVADVVYCAVAACTIHVCCGSSL